MNTPFIIVPTEEKHDYGQNDRQGKITDPYLTKEEYTKLLITRAKEISRKNHQLNGVTEEDLKYDNPAILVAQQEIKNGIIPYSVVRIIPTKDGAPIHEIWNINDMNVTDF